MRAAVIASYCRKVAWLAVLFAAPLPATEVDILTTAPRTGIYIETDYLADQPAACDWYFAADALLAAEPPATGDVHCRIIIRIRGVLGLEGAALFADVTERLLDWPAVPTRVVLNSKGGDSAAALAMARTIRRHALFRRRAAGVVTAIDEAESAVCFSACIILFAAGTQRHALFDEYDDPALPSRLGIHRPGQYDPRAARYDSGPDNHRIAAVRRQLERYFDSVGVSTELVDAMFAVPFDDIRLLTESEARAYRLVTSAP